MTTTILIATANRGKAKEIKEIFAASGWNIKFLFDLPELDSLVIQENAQSFEGNALIKAILAGEASGLITLADDSGLSIDALGGRPGVFSARYSGMGSDAANNEKVLAEMSGIPEEERSCRYICCVAIYDPKTKFVATTEGQWEGRISFEPRGEKSFGYAPIFLAADFEYQKTNAEFDPEELIMINHRGRAFRQAIDILRGYLGEK
ncbi:MAG: RdgB/HAM1 family non-canonical purine NTP pyrophosphatase [Patescibacteria group bacterium]|jgi:XTP/dITP diphosphohydrolase